jgi:uncharacterized protein (TIGR00725 family)
MKVIISICGSDIDDKELSSYALITAENIGRMVAQRGGIIVCGGRGGIMEAACRGAKSENGITVGILPDSRDEANEFVDIPIVTGLGHKRNYLVVNSADVVIAIGGRWGTLNEISYAMILEKPVILMKGTGGCVDKLINGVIMQNIENHYIVATSPQEAVEKAYELCN